MPEMLLNLNGKLLEPHPFSYGCVTSKCVRMFREEDWIRQPDGSYVHRKDVVRLVVSKGGDHIWPQC
jgi:hypothetical protein